MPLALISISWYVAITAVTCTWLQPKSVKSEKVIPVVVCCFLKDFVDTCMVCSECSFFLISPKYLFLDLLNNNYLLYYGSFSFIPCSERIYVAVTEMAALFPKRPRSETVKGSLRLLTSSACRLQTECRKEGHSNGGQAPDMQLVTQQVIQCAYDIAKAAKQLVTITTKENTN